MPFYKYEERKIFFIIISFFILGTLRQLFQSLSSYLDISRTMIRDVKSFRFRDGEMIKIDCIFFFSEKVYTVSRIRYARNTEDGSGSSLSPQDHYFPVMSARILDEFGLLPGDRAR